MRLRKCHIFATAAALAVALIVPVAQPVGAARASEGATATGEESSGFEGIGWEPCTTVADLEPVFVEPIDGTVAATNLPTAVTIPVYFHVINKGPLPTDGNVPDESIRQQIDVLNDAYAGGQGGAAARYRFETAGVERLTKPEWYTPEMSSAEENEMKLALHLGDARTLNVYVVRGDSWATFPWSYKKDGPYRDGIVLDWTTMPGHVVSGGPTEGSALVVGPYREGDVLVHEVGHWLGLHHTFWQGCGAFRGLEGDGVDDTPAHQMPTPAEENECAQRDTCPAAGVDPLHNFMNYQRDDCMSEFTLGQVERMDAMYAKYRLRQAR